MWLQQYESACCCSAGSCSSSRTQYCYLLLILWLLLAPCLSSGCCSKSSGCRSSSCCGSSICCHCSCISSFCVLSCCSTSISPVTPPAVVVSCPVISGSTSICGSRILSCHSWLQYLLLQYPLLLFLAPPVSVATAVWLPSIICATPYVVLLPNSTTRVVKLLVNKG